MNTTEQLTAFKAPFKVKEDVEDGIYQELDEQIYRLLPFANYSAVKKLALGATPAHYRAAHRGDDKKTKAKSFGQIVHTAVLMPAWFEQFQPLPEQIKRRVGKEWEALKEAHPDHEFLSAAEWNKFEAARDSAYTVREKILEHPVAKNLLAEFFPEAVIVWTDKETGVRCKCRIDVYSPQRRLIADIKTTSKPNPYMIAKSGYYLGYHIQAAMYTDAVQAITGKELAFWFIFVESEPPHLVAVANGHDAFDERVENSNPGGYLELGREQYKWALEVIAKCEESGEWDGWPLDPTEMVIPKYAGFEGVYNV